jgi:hypothetical protein
MAEAWPRSFTCAAFCLVGTAAYENAAAANTEQGEAGNSQSKNRTQIV